MLVAVEKGNEIYVLSNKIWIGDINMRLYSINMMIENVIKDTFTIVEKDNKSVCIRIDEFMKSCQNSGIKEYAYDNYSFTVVDSVDGYNINLSKMIK